MRRTLALAAAGLLALLAMPAPADALIPVGTVQVVVKYRTDTGSLPLVGVAVWLGIGTDADMHGCTDAGGVIEFTDVPADTDLVSATGPGGFEDGCTNTYFFNPDTGKEMTTVYWKGHHGVLVLDHTTVGAGETLVMRHVVRTPDQHGELCNGLWATWVGTRGRDRFTGTKGWDIINARGGNDLIEGARGWDFICGANGDDTLRGEKTMDTLWGGPGSDVLTGGRGPDVVIGGPGQDACRGEDAYECE